MRFLDVKTDYAFKKVFGSEGSKDILLSFVNAIIKFKDGSVIDDLTIVDPYQIPLLRGMKDSYVDVKATLSNGNKVIIEMQVLAYEGFEKRILYNAAKAYSTQLLSGEDYALLNPIIAITITDFEMFPEFDKCTSYFRLLEKTELVEYGGDIELIFIELPKFKLSEEALTNITDKWIYFIKNAGSLAYVPKSLETEKAIGKAFEIVNEAGLSPEELEIQHKRKDFIWINRKSIETAQKQGKAAGKAEGLAEGIEKGKTEGLLQGKREIALRLLSRGMDKGEVMKITELSEAVLYGIKEKQ